MNEPTDQENDNLPSDDFHSPADSPDGLTTSSVNTQLLKLLKGTSEERLIQGLALFNLFIIFSRLPDSIPILGILKITVLIAGTCFALSLSKIPFLLNYTPIKILLGLLVYNALFIFIGHLIVPDLVLNDGQAFATWRSLTQDFLTFFLPLVALSHFGVGIKRIHTTAIFCGVYLGLYALTHGGRGPGGFVGDENDLCLVLVMFFPFAALEAASVRGLARKAVFLTACLVMLGGIVATNSRGGFLGLVVTLAYLFWNSPRKLPMIVGASLLSLTTLPFVPSSYWEEVESISADASSDTGTGRERLDSWAIGLNMWLDPANFIQGVGLGNGPWRMNEYEPIERGMSLKSLAGRKFHSTYVELVTDQGLVGLIFIGSLVWYTFKRNNTIARQMQQTQRATKQAYREILSKRKQIVSRGGDIANYLDNRLFACQLLSSHLSTWQLMAISINVALCAVMASGVFISVLYYPPLWFLLFVAVGVDITWRRLHRLSKSIAHTEDLYQKQKQH